MIRRVFIFTALLLLGAVLNFVVASWCAARPPSNPATRGATWLSQDDYVYDHGPMHITVWKRFGCIGISDNRWNSFDAFSTRNVGARMLTDDEWRGILPRSSAFRAGSPLDEPSLDSRYYFLSFQERSAGWPCYAFTSTFFEADSMAIGVKGERTTSGVLTLRHGWLPATWTSDVPVIPAWPGFAANTAFYAAAIWLVALGPIRLRRSMRKRRSRCLTCNYDLRSNTTGVCP